MNGNDSKLKEVIDNIIIAAQSEEADLELISEAGRLQVQSVIHAALDEIRPNGWMNREDYSRGQSQAIIKVRQLVDSL